MTALTDTWRVFRYAALTGFQDFRSEYSVVSWISEWLVRIVFQMIFFALIGRLVGSEEQVRFLVIGNGVMLASMTVMFVVQSTTWERFTGTLPLLIAAPASPLVVFAGRSVEWIPDAIATSLAGLFIVAPLFGVDVPVTRVLLILPLLLLITLTTYAFGLFLGSLVLRAMMARNLVANLGYSALMALAGVNVPVTFFPEPLQLVASLLPLTHGLAAVRAVLDGATLTAVGSNVMVEAIVGCGWLALALASFRWLAEGGRKDGTIEFGV